MSNLEQAPAELVCSADTAPAGKLLDGREVPLGGPRSMMVRRTLPQREQSLIGAWCFVDHYGPDDVSATGGMAVPGHPHTGLQTVSWLFSGEVEHRDTTGAHAVVRPGEINLMTAGSGIAHSEHSLPGTSVLHGAQLWIALPDRDRFVDPAFEHYAPPVHAHDGARVVVFLGTLLGHTSPVATHTPLLGAEITLRPGQVLRLDVEAGFEHGVLVDTGEVHAAGVTASAGKLVYQPTGSTSLTLEAGDEPARVLVLGGEPLGERIVMWWNFIARSHDEIVTFREQWQRARSGVESGRYGEFPEQWAETLPAPVLPNIRLRSRG
ncbi:pirin family protein [Actinokineospora xionganensis]|uniref:Pirin family protein n=1 Tax=Actinokineospora xionganensis TaxID=2684470 RepID=A0ABR7LCB8_9PSEU|nr:pirin family protein [Actinokineospora xionganensis]MBC6450019.1 pirin family protein [Actinokineospora xionganensis]